MKRARGKPDTGGARRGAQARSDARGSAGSASGTRPRNGGAPREVMANRSVWGARPVRRTREEQLAAVVAENVPTPGATALYQPLALPSSSSSASSSASSSDSAEPPMDVEQRVLAAMVAGQPNTGVARLEAALDAKVRDKAVPLFVRRVPTGPGKRGRVAAAYARHSTRPRRVAERTGRTVCRAAPAVDAAATALAAMAADGRQLPGLAVVVRASRRLPHLVGRAFTVLGAYRARRSVLLYDRARAQTVRCEVDDIQACLVPRLRAVVPLRHLVQNLLS